MVTFVARIACSAGSWDVFFRKELAEFDTTYGEDHPGASPTSYCHPRASRPGATTHSRAWVIYRVRGAVGRKNIFKWFHAEFAPSNWNKDEQSVEYVQPGARKHLPSSQNREQQRVAKLVKELLQLFLPGANWWSIKDGHRTAGGSFCFISTALWLWVDERKWAPLRLACGRDSLHGFVSILLMRGLELVAS